MAYTPISLADIYQQGNAIKGQQQRQQFGALQLQQAQDQEAKTSALDTILQNNPNASSADLIKAGGASAIPIAAQQQQLTAQADEQTYRKLFAAASEAVVAKDPIAYAKSHPDFIKQFESQNGPGSFDQLSPDQVRQMAAGIRDHAQQLLVDPKTQFQVTHEDQRAANTQAGDNARNAATIAATAANSRYTQGQENTRAAASRAVTTRGQDLTNANQGVPAGYERDPDKPGALRPIAGGPHDPSSVTGKLTETQGNAKAFGLRMTEANARLEEQVGKGGYNPTGLRAAMDKTTAGTWANFLTSDAGQKFQNSAMGFVGPALRKESGAAISESEWKNAAKLWIPIPGDSAAVLAQKKLNRADEIRSLAVQAGPGGLPALQGSAPAAQGWTVQKVQ